VPERVLIEAPNAERRACHVWRHAMRWLLSFALVAIGLLHFLAGSLAAQGIEGGVSREFPIKVAYLYNFANYVEWPATAFASNDAPFVIGVLGPDPFGQLLDELAAAKTVRGRRIIVQRFATADQVKPCQMLFIAPSVNKTQRTEALTKLANHPVLIVTDSPNDKDGIISFVNENNRIRFMVNAGAATQRDLKISSKILALAKSVNTN
jgi:hypothetical protein